MNDFIFLDDEPDNNISNITTTTNNNTFFQQNDEDDEDPWAFRSLSDSQKTILAVLPIPSAILSIFGSSVIIYMAYLSKKSKPWTPYNRLLVAMSVYDIITSITLASASFLNPMETSTKALALGNESTCSAIGFMNQISYSGTLYNAALSYYFLFTARFGMKNNLIAKWIEPFMHCFSVGWPTITAFVGLFLGVYAEPEVGLGCWVNRYPKRCGYGPDGTGEPCLSSMVSWIFGGWVAIFTLFSLIINNFVIWIFVRRRISKAMKARGEDDEDNRSLAQFSFASSLPTSGYGGKSIDRFSQFSTSGGGGGASSSVTVMNVDIRKSQQKRMRLVSSQTFLFVASYFVSSMSTYILRLFESMATDYTYEMELPYNNYTLLVMQAILLPLQGLFNMMVYLRPKYLKNRSDFDRESRLWAIRRAIWGRGVQPIHSIKVNKDGDDANNIRNTNNDGNKKNVHQRALSKDMISSLTTGSGGGGAREGGGSDDDDDDEDKTDLSRLYQQSGQAAASRNSLEMISEDDDSIGLDDDDDDDANINENDGNRQSKVERRLSIQSDNSGCSAAILMDGSIRESRG